MSGWIKQVATNELMKEYNEQDIDPSIDKEAIQWLINENKLDVRPIVAITMRACGLTFREIGMTFGISKQAVDSMIKKWEISQEEIQKQV